MGILSAKASSALFVLHTHPHIHSNIDKMELTLLILYLKIRLVLIQAGPTVLEIWKWDPTHKNRLRTIGH
jgi:hypothetical protein